MDPINNEELGTINVVKGRVRAEAVYDRFTIATSRWNITHYSMGGIFSPGLLGAREIEDKQEVTLHVKNEDIKPWNAISKEVVKVGDEVEVTIVIPEPKDEGDEENSDKK